VTSYLPIGEILPGCRKKLLSSLLLKEILRKNQNKLPKIFPMILYRWKKTQKNKIKCCPLLRNYHFTLVVFSQIIYFLEVLKFPPKRQIQRIFL
jgi:hypothetical protein